MAKAIMKTFLETSPITNLKINTDEIVQDVENGSVVKGGPYRVIRICTKKDNDLKAIMAAHLKTRASEQTMHYIRKH